MATLSRLAEAVDRATPASQGDDRLLSELGQLLRGERLVSVGEAATFLGVSSPQTIRNYIQSGLFPEASRTAGGHRRIRLSDVLAARERIERVRIANASGAVEIRDFGDDDPYAGR